MKKAWVLSYPLSALRRLWSDWVDAQADLSLCWVHTHFVGFVMSRLKSYINTACVIFLLLSTLFFPKNFKKMFHNIINMLWSYLNPLEKLRKKLPGELLSLWNTACFTFLDTLSHKISQFKKWNLNGMVVRLTDICAIKHFSLLSWIC